MTLMSVLKKWFLSVDGKKLYALFRNENKLEVTDLGAKPFQKEMLSLDLPLSELGKHISLLSIRNERYLTALFKPHSLQMNRPNYFHADQLIVVVDLVTGKVANVSYTGSPVMSSHYFKPLLSDSNELLFLESDYPTRSLYKIDVSSSLFGYDGEIDELSLSTPRGFTVQGNISSESPLYLITRKTDKGAVDGQFINITSEFTDYKYGLKVADYVYDVLACNNNFVCNQTGLKTSEVTVKGFSQTPSVSVIKPEEITETSNNRLKLSIELSPEADSGNLWDIGKGVRDVYESWEPEVYFEGRDVALTISNCLTNFDRTKVCGEYVDPIVIKTPAFLSDNHLSTRMTPDFKSVFVNWTSYPEYSYKLYRRLDNNDEYQLVYQGSGNEFIDKELLFGSNYYYRLVQCVEQVCSATNSRGLKLDRISYRPNIDVDFDETKGMAISWYNGYRYDSYRVFRRVSTIGAQEQLIATLSYSRNRFLDADVQLGTNYYYRIEGCFESECTTLGEREDRADNTISAFSLSDVPSNIRAEITHYREIGVSWNRIANADGYLVSINGNYPREVTGGDTTRFRYVLKDDLGEKISFSVASFVYSNTESKNKYVSDYSAPVSVDSITSISNRKLQQLALSASLYNYEKHVVLKWDADHAFSSVKVYERQKNESKFTHIGTQENARYNSYTVDKSDASFTEFEYKIVGCVTLFNQCSADSNIAEVDLYVDYDVEELRTGPSVELTPSGELQVTPVLPDSSLIEDIELRMYIGDSQDYYRQLRRDYPEYDQFLISLSTIESGQRYRFTTRYCYRNDQNSESCTLFSEATSFTISDNPKIIPHVPSIDSIELNRTDDGLVLSLATSVSTSQVYRHPERLVFYKATDGNALEEYFTAAFTQENIELRGYDFSDTNVKLGNQIRYQVKACNESGCSSLSAARGTTISEPQEPQVPHVTRIRSHSIEPITGMPQVNIYGSEKATSFRFKYWTLEQYQYAKYVSSYGLTASLNQAEKGFTYYVQVEACNRVGCSEPSAPYKLLVPGKFDADTSISGELLRQVSESSNRFAESSWTLDGSVNARAGRLDTMTGELSARTLFHLKNGYNTFADVFLSVKNVGSCETLFKEQLSLPGRERYDTSFNRVTFEILYTGTGCELYPELDYYSLYIVSPYLSEPVLVVNKELWLDRWSELNVVMDEKGRLSLLRSGEVVVTADTTVDNDLFSYSQFKWTVPQNNSISRILISGVKSTINSGQVSQTIYVNGVHPRVLELRSTLGSRLEYWLVDENSVADKQVEEPVSSVYSTTAYIPNLRPSGDYRVIVRECNNDSCTPGYVLHERLNGYFEFSHYDKPSIANNGSYKLALQIGVDSRMNADSFALSGRRENDVNWQLLGTKSVGDIFEELDDKPLHEYLWHVDDYQEGDRVQFKIKVCNQLGCVESEPSEVILVPVDSDGDGIIDEFDEFPSDPKEWKDYDNDGIGNNADTDDDNDGMSDEMELSYGLDSQYSYDLGRDEDDDGFVNLIEIMTGSDLHDPLNTPAVKGRFISFESNSLEGIQTSEPLATGILEITNDYDTLAGELMLKKSFKQANTNEVTITLFGNFYQGSLGWAANTKNSGHIPQVKVNGKEAVVTSIPVSKYQWVYNTVKVGDGVAEVTISYHKNAETDFTTLSLDAFFLPVKVSPPDSDFNADGMSDILWRNNKTGENEIWFMENSLSYPHPYLPQVANQNWRIAGVGHFNEDDYPDIVWRNNSSGQNTLWIMEDGYQIDNQALSKVASTNWEIKGVGDFNNDGTDDLLWYRNDTGALAVWGMLNGQKVASTSQPVMNNQSWQIAAIGDLNNNGTDDIIWRQKESGEQSVWFMAANYRQSSRPLPRLSELAWQIFAANDFTGDGKTDLLLRNTATNEISVWAMNGINRLSQVRFNDVLSEDWILATSGDYNGDGIDDLLWRNTINGETEVWFFYREGQMERVATNQSTNVNWDLVHTH